MIPQLSSSDKGTIPNISHKNDQEKTIIPVDLIIESKDNDISIRSADCAHQWSDGIAQRHSSSTQQTAQLARQMFSGAEWELVPADSSSSDAPIENLQVFDPDLEDIAQQIRRSNNSPDDISDASIRLAQKGLLADALKLVNDISCLNTLAKTLAKISLDLASDGWVSVDLANNNNAQWAVLFAKKMPNVVGNYIYLREIAIQLAKGKEFQKAEEVAEEIKDFPGFRNTTLQEIALELIRNESWEDAQRVLDRTSDMQDEQWQKFASVLVKNVGSEKAKSFAEKLPQQSLLKTLIESSAAKWEAQNSHSEEVQYKDTVQILQGINRELDQLEKLQDHAKADLIESVCEQVKVCIQDLEEIKGIFSFGEGFSLITWVDERARSENCGEISTKLAQNDRSDEALSLIEFIDDKNIQARALTSIALILIEKGEYEKATTCSSEMMPNVAMRDVYLRRIGRKLKEHQKS